MHDNSTVSYKKTTLESQIFSLKEQFIWIQADKGCYQCHSLSQFNRAYRVSSEATEC